MLMTLAKRFHFFIALLFFLFCGLYITSIAIKNKDAPLLVSALLLCILSVSIIFYIYIKFLLPLGKLKKININLTNKEIKALFQGLFGMTQGEFKSHIESSLKEEKIKGHYEVEQLSNSLNGFKNEINMLIKEFNALTFDSCRRICFVGPDAYQTGRCAGKYMGEILRGKGTIAIITWITNYSYIFWLRRRGFEEYIYEHHPDIKVVEILDGKRDDKVSYMHTINLIKKYRNLRGIYVSTVRHTAGVAKAIDEKKLSEKIKIVSHGNHLDVMEYVGRNIISGNIPDDTFQMGYDPVIYLYNYLVTGEHNYTERCIIPDRMVTVKNIKELWDFKTGFIENSTTSKRLMQPVESKPCKNLKIAYVEFEDNDFCRQMKNGALAAAEKLKHNNFTLECVYIFEKATEINPDFKKLEGTSFTEEIWDCGMQQLAVEKYDGLITQATSEFMIRVINRAVDKGIAVVTNNQEPISIRGFLTGVLEQATNLNTLSTEVTEAITKVSHTSTEITESMQYVKEGVNRQQKEIVQTNDVLKEHVDTVKKVSEHAKEGGEYIFKASEQIINSMEDIKFTLKNVESIKKSVETAGSTISELISYTEKIDSIVVLINDIASETNVLSINAAIKAARAGQAGKSFGIIANEIRNLASNSEQAGNEITLLIRQIQSLMVATKNNMHVIEKDAVEGSNVAVRAEGILQNINRTLLQNNDMINKIINDLFSIEDLADRVAGTLKVSASVSTENNAITEEVSTSIASMITLMNQVVTSANKFRLIAKSQMDFMEKFSL